MIICHENLLFKKKFKVQLEEGIKIYHLFSTYPYTANIVFKTSIPSCGLV